LKKNILFIFFLSLCYASSVFAHGDLDERILEVTNEIKIAPDSAYLYLKRAKLHYQHETYTKSISDLKRSQKLGLQNIEQQLHFAKAYFRMNDHQKSLNFIDEILKEQPNHVRAIKLRAQNYFSLGDYLRSAISYEEVIDNASKTFPENYIDASIAWEMLNTEEGSKNAKAVMLRGIDDLGKLISLYERLIELDTAQKDYNAAIKTQLQVVDLMPRKERAYFKLCDLYVMNNEMNNAKESLEFAKEHYNKLPLRIKNTSFMKELLANIKIKERLF
jgi:tetratricopeptide (TPR) repeat protein